MGGCEQHGTPNKTCPRCVSVTALIEQRRLREARARRRGHPGDVPPRFREARFDNYQADTDPLRLRRNVIETYAREFADEHLPNGRGGALVGATGTGKTHLACALIHALLEQGFSARYTTQSEMLRAFRQSFGPEAMRDEDEVLNDYASPDLLVLDEVGMAIGHEERRRLMTFEVINRRYELTRPTLVVSNLNREGLHGCLGGSALDRLLDRQGFLLSFDFDSWRQRS